MPTANAIRRIAESAVCGALVLGAVAAGVEYAQTGESWVFETAWGWAPVAVALALPFLWRYRRSGRWL